MDPTVRAIIMSTRPWSIPASLVPGALAAALSFSPARGIEGVIDASLAVMCGLLAHVGANCVNTYFDFKSGLDRPSTSDDRALVDNLVSERTLIISAAVCYLLSICISVRFILLLGSTMGYLIFIGMLLSFFYTASPLSLKHMGLGDLVIFICFGPLLMTSVAAATSLSTSVIPSLSVLLMSIPVGLLTVNILHANNTRDIKTDAAGGAKTLAGVIGFKNSYALYVLYLIMSYPLTALALSAHLAESASLSLGVKVPMFEIMSTLPTHLSKVPLSALPLTILRLFSSNGSNVSKDGLLLDLSVRFARSILFLCAFTAPWAVSNVRRFSKKQLATLPQSSAQFQLLFGAGVFCGLLPLDALARLLLAVLFYLGGVQNVLMARHTSALVHQKISSIVSLPNSVTDLLAGLATSAQLVASVLLAIGRKEFFAREAAAVLVLFLIPVTASVHDMWNFDIDLDKEYREVEDGDDSDEIVNRKSKKGLQKRRQSDASNISSKISSNTPDFLKAQAAGNVPTFLTAFDNEFVHFFKNIMGLGGLLVYLAYADV
jgi:1,4-dihydroxy-2-naphthoate octaprenyltransferase/uncharacterized membrane protein YphA (DoxX/SURF4 family)